VALRSAPYLRLRSFAASQLRSDHRYVLCKEEPLPLSEEVLPLPPVAAPLYGGTWRRSSLRRRRGSASIAKGEGVSTASSPYQPLILRSTMHPAGGVRGCALACYRWGATKGGLKVGGTISSLSGSVRIKRRSSSGCVWTLSSSNKAALRRSTATPVRCRTYRRSRCGSCWSWAY
jgi:hypothetical protein